MKYFFSYYSPFALCALLLSWYACDAPRQEIIIDARALYELRTVTEEREVELRADSTGREMNVMWGAGPRVEPPRLGFEVPRDGKWRVFVMVMNFPKNPDWIPEGEYPKIGIQAFNDTREAQNVKHGNPQELDFGVIEYTGSQWDIYYPNDTTFPDDDPDTKTGDGDLNPIVFRVRLVEQ
jgi:hypothetical protein